MRRNRRDGLRAPRPAAFARCPPASAPPRLAALRRPCSHTRGLPGPAAPCGLTCRSTSAASAPASRKQPAPYTPASCPAVARAAPGLQLPHHSRSTPPAAARPARPRAPSPRLPARPHTATALPRSRPARSGSRAASPGHPPDPGTPDCRPATSVPGPLSCTSAHGLRRGTGSPRSALPSAPGGSDNRVPRRRRRCTSPLSPPPAPARRAHPARTPAGPGYADRSGCPCPAHRPPPAPGSSRGPWSQ